MARPSFGEADLSGASIHGSDLSGCKLSGAALANAQLSETKLDGAESEATSFEHRCAESLPRKQVLLVVPKLDAFG